MGNGTECLGSGSKSRMVVRSKTTSAPVSKETDDRIVNVGLVVAVLGLLSFAVS